MTHWYNKFVCYFWGHKTISINVWGFPALKCTRCGWCHVSSKSTLITRKK